MQHLAPLGALGCVLVLACSPPSVARPSPLRSSLIEYDSLVARREPGPHNGGGETTAFSFFDNETGLSIVFRKRELHAGSAIGYHRNDEDEIYYVLAGRGELTLNAKRSFVGPGTAILTRAGDSHGLRQVGGEDLVILITYPRSPSQR
jgi:mannose-6-phosphate isomerase-like protein (cupin superfamily)